MHVPATRCDHVLLLLLLNPDLNTITVNMSIAVGVTITTSTSQHQHTCSPPPPLPLLPRADPSSGYIFELKQSGSSLAFKYFHGGWSKWQLDGRLNVGLNGTHSAVHTQSLGNACLCCAAVTRRPPYPRLLPTPRHPCLLCPLAPCSHHQHQPVGVNNLQRHPGRRRRLCCWHSVRAVCLLACLPGGLFVYGGGNVGVARLNCPAPPPCCCFAAGFGYNEGMVEHLLSVCCCLVAGLPHVGRALIV